MGIDGDSRDLHLLHPFPALACSCQARSASPARAGLAACPQARGKTTALFKYQKAIMQPFLATIPGEAMTNPEGGRGSETSFLTDYLILSCLA